MAKVEIKFQNGAHRVEVCFREPFEDIFEIATHAARFENIRDAVRLAERFREAIRANGLSRSVACIMRVDQWVWQSSAYRSLATMAAENPLEYYVPASAAARAAAALVD